MARSHARLALAATLGLPVLGTGQAPSLTMHPDALLTSQGFPIQTSLVAAPGAAFTVFLDFDGGPREVLGERILLGLTPLLSNFDGGVVGPGGTSQRSVQVPLFAGALGLILYGQAVVLDYSAPNGLFRTSNGASTATYAGSRAIVASFDDPVNQGYSGTYSADVAGHVRGGPVTRRTYETITPLSVPVDLLSTGFLSAPLSTHGCRVQYVLRNVDLGASGAPERITSVRWHRQAGASVLPTPDTFPAFDFRIGHTDVVPDYTLDWFSALPVAPDSGLSATFADNERPGEPPIVVYQGPYVVSPSDLLLGGYLPFPMFTSFPYDGVSSLLLEFRVPAWPQQGLNPIAHRLQAVSSPLPAARVVRSGTAAAPITPDLVTTGTRDNAMPELQIEFTRTETFAQSPWLLAGAAQFGTPILAQSLPFGTSIAVEYRGADSPIATPTAWSSSPNIAAGKLYLQFRVTFHANPVTGERPILDSLIVPVP
ncbi:MAG: hypothetical protein JNM25_14520 [Planctomycetes bacterium]|nr:hypothetical protein [Planctomycetota bacterium]